MKNEDELMEIKKKLEEHEKRISSLERLMLKFEEKPAPIKEPGFEKLARKVGVDVEKIKGLFDIENSTLTLLKAIGKDVKEKTQKISLVVLLGYKYILGSERVSATELRRNVAENRIPLDNFARHLNGIIPSLIRRIGKKKSPKTAYRLTPMGEAEAKDIIKELCGSRKNGNA